MQKHEEERPHREGREVAQREEKLSVAKSAILENLVRAFGWLCSTRAEAIPSRPFAPFAVRAPGLTRPDKVSAVTPH